MCAALSRSAGASPATMLARFNDAGETPRSGRGVMSERNRLIEINLDEASVAPASANAEHDRRIALFDLKEFNSFAVLNEDRGPYVLLLGMSEGRLVLDVSDESGARIICTTRPSARCARS